MCYTLRLNKLQLIEEIFDLFENDIVIQNNKKNSKREQTHNYNNFIYLLNAR